MARGKAERERAKADKAYREELGLSTQEFITLKWIETIAAKNGADVYVTLGSSSNVSLMRNAK
jgi:hypothetical protein